MGLSKRKKSELDANYRSFEKHGFPDDLSLEDPLQSEEVEEVEDVVSGKVKKTRTLSSTGLVAETDGGDCSYDIHPFDVDSKDIEVGDTVEGVVFEYEKDASFSKDGFLYPGMVEKKNE